MLTTPPILNIEESTLRTVPRAKDLREDMNKLAPLWDAKLEHQFQIEYKTQ